MGNAEIAINGEKKAGRKKHGLLLMGWNKSLMGQLSIKK